LKNKDLTIKGENPIEEDLIVDMAIAFKGHRNLTNLYTGF